MGTVLLLNFAPTDKPTSPWIDTSTIPTTSLQAHPLSFTYISLYYYLVSNRVLVEDPTNLSKNQSTVQYNIQPQNIKLYNSQITPKTTKPPKPPNIKSYHVILYNRTSTSNRPSTLPTDTSSNELKILINPISPEIQILSTTSTSHRPQIIKLNDTHSTIVQYTIQSQNHTKPNDKKIRILYRTILLFHYKSNRYNYKSIPHTHKILLAHSQSYLRSVKYSQNIDNLPLFSVACLAVLADYQWKHYPSIISYDDGIPMETLIFNSTTSIHQTVNETITPHRPLTLLTATISHGPQINTINIILAQSHTNIQIFDHTQTETLLPCNPKLNNPSNHIPITETTTLTPNYNSFKYLIINQSITT
eukprot:541491_1